MSNLGAVPGLPSEYGGLTFKLGDPNTILIGGNAGPCATNKLTQPPYWLRINGH
jgi:hypothetical protein